MDLGDHASFVQLEISEADVTRLYSFINSPEFASLECRVQAEAKRQLEFQIKAEVEALEALKPRYVLEYIASFVRRYFETLY
jgi:DNA topoisomerase VI subunit A